MPLVAKSLVVAKVMISVSSSETGQLFHPLTVVLLQGQRSSPRQTLTELFASLVAEGSRHQEQ